MLRKILQTRLFFLSLFISIGIIQSSYLAGELNTGNENSQSASQASTPPVKLQKVNEPNSSQKPVGNFINQRLLKGSQLPLTVGIIESQSYNPGHVMDNVWFHLADSMGYNTSILPQSALTNINSLQDLDILIVSSGVINIYEEAKNSIITFIMQGKSVYLQGEYLCNYTTNLIFADIVDSLGGSFFTTGTLSGDLIPMRVFGILSTTPNLVNTLNYFWYGCEGEADSVTVLPFLEYSGSYFGFIFTPPHSGYGRLITTSDQDWIRDYIRTKTALPLMANILNYLAGTTIGIEQPFAIHPEYYLLKQNYPNPFNSTTTIEFDLAQSEKVTLKIFTISGEEVATLLDDKIPAGNYKCKWQADDMASGIYLYHFNAGGYVETNKMILLK